MHSTHHSNNERSRRTAALLDRARCASEPERRRLLDEVIVLNIPVAQALAGRYRHRGQPIEDLEQVASLALTRCVHSFRPERGEDLLVFAVPCVLGELKRHFRDATWVIRPPRRLQELRPSIAVAEAELTQRLGRSPRPGEIAAEIGCDEDQVAEAIACDDCAHPVALDATIAAAPDLERIAALATEEAGFGHAEAVTVLSPACRRLDRRDRQILRMRFYEQLTQQQIADELGVTQAQVSRLLNRILQNLRAWVGTRGEPDAA